ncbi:MAG: ABC transporter permease [Chloroflexota bacterium]|nr:FtsX-like permease family protein [Anaerolineales bacterium]
MSVIWYKVWFDLWHNKMRTLLAVLSIAAGVFAVGAIFGMSELLSTNMNRSHRAVLPTHINVSLTTLVDEDTIESIRDVPGVEDVEPYNSATVLYKLHPEDDWRQGVIQMRHFESQKYELLQLRGGHWPETKNEVAVERMAAQFLGVGTGDSIIFKIDDKERTLPVTGLIRHPFVPPPQFMDLAFFFMSGAGMERLGIPEGKFSSFYVRVTPYSYDHAREVASAIKDKLSKQNIGIGAFVYEDPEKHWGMTFMDGFTLVQKLLAMICVVVGAILIYNTLSNLITQQTNQIGILKAIGGKTSTIVGIYLVNALVYGLLGLAVALPLGAIVAFSVTRVFLNLFNIDYNQFELSRQAVTFQVISAFTAPLLAGLPPVLHGANITVRQAIASYGLGGDFRSGRLDRLVDTFGQRWLSSQYATALGNMFRHRGRLMLTQIVLITAGSAFLMVMSLNSSCKLTLDNLFGRRHFDTTIQFEANQRAERVQALAATVPGVDKAELRLEQSATLFLEGQLVKEAGIGSSLQGIPTNSDFSSPLIVAGRWFRPDENGRAVVITRQMAEDNHIQVGDTVTLDLGEMGKDKWQVIGMYDPVFVGGFNQDTIFAPLEALYQTTKKYGQGAVLYVRTTSHDPDFTSAVTKQLKEMYERHGLQVAISETQAESRSTADWQFAIVIWMMMALSVIVALVGGLALMGALSIGVIERTKEIGVLRAIGARSSSILGIFVMEGLLQGLLSWLIAMPLSFLVSPLLANALGNAMFGATLDYQYNWSAVMVWLGTVLVISIVASVLPARNATRISVRDSLAYA